MLFYQLATKQYTVLFLPNSQVNLEPRVSCALHNSLPRAKDGKCQKRQGLDVLAVFPIPPSATSCTHLPLQGRRICLFNSGSPKSVSFLGKRRKERSVYYEFCKNSFKHGISFDVVGANIVRPIIFHQNPFQSALRCLLGNTANMIYGCRY